MALLQSPPTTSGIVVLSGTNEMFGLFGEFPVIRGLVWKGSVLHDDLPGPLTLVSEPSIVQISVSNNIVSPLIFADQEDGAPGQKLANDIRLVNVLDMGSNTDVGIISTEVTTSGIVILDIFPNAGVPPVPFVPPVVINARTFPVFQGSFPEQDSRIFPRLPQFSILTPGD